mmetsp:Transcript_35503/g.81272  ORF Transcript_35503/g.81272 Transcript_35503/m.81272 type:complete len:282 (+) Transcript_35503:457-1302(+)
MGPSVTLDPFAALLSPFPRPFVASASPAPIGAVPLLFPLPLGAFPPSLSSSWRAVDLSFPVPFAPVGLGLPFVAAASRGDGQSESSFWLALLLPFDSHLSFKSLPLPLPLPEAGALPFSTSLRSAFLDLPFAISSSLTPESEDFQGSLSSAFSSHTLRFPLPFTGSGSPAPVGRPIRLDSSILARSSPCGLPLSFLPLPFPPFGCSAAGSSCRDAFDFRLPAGTALLGELAVLCGSSIRGWLGASSAGSQLCLSVGRQPVDPLMAMRPAPYSRLFSVKDIA